VTSDVRSKQRSREQDVITAINIVQKCIDEAEDGARIECLRAALVNLHGAEKTVCWELSGGK